MQRLLIALALFLAACSAAATPLPDGAPIAVATPYPTSAPPADAAAVQLSNAPVGRMVIKDATLDLLVQDTDRAIAQVMQWAADSGGYVISSQTWSKGGIKYATLRLGVPSTAFEPTLNFLRTLAVRVQQESTAGQDVSAEYVDLQTRLANLEATSARVREFLGDAQTVEESLKINQELSALEGQIAQIKGQMKYYEGRSAYSTITVQLAGEHASAAGGPRPQWNPAQTFAVAAGLLAVMAQGAADVLIWILMIGGPVVLAGGLIFGLARWLFRRFGP